MDILVDLPGRTFVSKHYMLNSNRCLKFLKRSFIVWIIKTVHSGPKRGISLSLFILPIHARQEKSICLSAPPSPRVNMSRGKQWRKETLFFISRVNTSGIFLSLGDQKWPRNLWIQSVFSRPPAYSLCLSFALSKEEIGDKNREVSFVELAAFWYPAWESLRMHIWKLLNM